MLQLLSKQARAQVNFYVHHEKLVILILDSIHRSRILRRREGTTLYSSRSIVFHSGQHTLKGKTRDKLFLEEYVREERELRAKSYRKRRKNGT